MSTDQQLPDLPVETTYRLTESDFAAMQESFQQRRRGRAGPVVYWGFVIAFFAVGAWLLWESYMQGEADHAMFILYVALAFLMPAMRDLYVPVLRRRRFRASMLGDRTFRLTADVNHLSIDSGDSGSRTAWAHQAVIVPLVAFRDDESRKRLWTLATEGGRSVHA